MTMKDGQGQHQNEKTEISLAEILFLNPEDEKRLHPYALKCFNDWKAKILNEVPQLENTKNLENVMQEYEVLEPFKAFLNMPCEICHEPVAEWGDYSVKLAIEGIGCGHTACWHSKSGQMKELLKAIQKFKKDTK